MACKCIETVNKQLAEHNAALPTELFMSLKSGTARIAMVIPLRTCRAESASQALCAAVLPVRERMGQG